MSTQFHAPLQSHQTACDPSDYVVGRDPHGFWVAVEIHGRSGGLFRSREAATDYAAFETGRRADAVRVMSEPVTLRI